MPKGIYKRKTGRKYNVRVKTYPVNDWVTVYQTGLTYKEVGKFFHVSKHIISRELNKIGVKRKSVLVKNTKRNTHSDFLSAIKKNDKTGCWEWQKGVSSNGYGQFCIGGVNILAHRYSYDYYRGDLKEFHVCHKCDNPRCVNPDHLFLGTRQDNMIDRSIKGRNNEKLNPDKVREIRKLTSKGVQTNKIAKMFSVHQRTIECVQQGRNWSYVV